jgi:membrane protease YdiL (CAAX protease family)
MADEPDPPGETGVNREGPTQRIRFGAITEVAASTIVLVYNVVINRAIPSIAYVPSNFAFAGLSVVGAHALGVSLGDMGLRRDRVDSGIRVGLVAVALIAAAIVLGVALPASRGYFEDARALGGGIGHVLYEILVRIPLGTAVAEETIFRGALLGLFLQRHSRLAATLISSLVFGFWHVLPTLDTIRANPAGSLVQGDALRTGGAVLVSVLVTAAAGCGFSWLRFRSDSLVAPILAHASLNSFAFIAARLVTSSLG